MFTPSTIAILASVLILAVVLFLWLKRIEDKTKDSREMMEWIKELNRRVDASGQSVDRRLAESMKLFNARLDNTSLVISQLQKNVGEFSEIGRSMRDLQELLQSPKLRGNIGEHILQELLTQYFPQDSFSLQYPFRSGEKVDAIIRTSQGIIPIDAKFPFENFRKLHNAQSDADRKEVRKLFERDVKKHIHDIERKYIRHDEGTVDYAIMYIPSEAVYYEIVNSPDLFDLAGERRILPVSPMSFYAYMKAILMSFEGQKIEKQAKEILAMLNALKRDYDKTEEAITLMNKHVTNAYNQSNTVVRSFGALGQKLKTPHPLTGDTPAASLSESEEASRVTVAHSPAKSSVNRSGPVEPDIIT